MRDMIYGGNPGVLYHYEKDGYGVLVVSIRGTHPCGYVTFPKIGEVEDYEGMILENVELDEWTDPHGGFTFLGTMECYDIDGTWIGWDYAHLGDYTCSSILYSPDDRKYTTEEIVDECYEILRFIKNGWYKVYKKES